MFALCMRINRQGIKKKVINQKKEEKNSSQQQAGLTTAPSARLGRPLTTTAQGND